MHDDLEIVSCFLFSEHVVDILKYICTTMASQPVSRFSLPLSASSLNRQILDKFWLIKPF